MARVNITQETLSRMIQKAGLTVRKIGRSHFELSCPESGVIGIGNSRKHAYDIAYRHRNNKKKA